MAIVHVWSGETSRSKIKKYLKNQLTVDVTFALYQRQYGFNFGPHGLPVKDCCEFFEIIIMATKVFGSYTC